MSVIQFWRERLAARRPLGGPMWKEGEDYKPHLDKKRRADSWPHSVCRDVLYRDYLWWFEETFLKAYRGVAFFDDENMPKPEDALTFFCGMSPLLYLAGKDVQVRNYQVPVSVRHEGKWIKVRKWRYFVRLCDWETHVAAFELATGLPVAGNVAFFEAEKAKRLSTDVTNFKVKIAETLPAVRGG